MTERLNYPGKVRGQIISFHKYFSKFTIDDEKQERRVLTRKYECKVNKHIYIHIQGIINCSKMQGTKRLFVQKAQNR